MRRPSPMVDRGGSVDMDSAMTPMIDVVFLLLVFFVWTASFQIIEQILPSQMSSQVGSDVDDLSEPPPELDFDNVVVRIIANGQAVTWRLNDVPVETLDALNHQLTAIARIKLDAPVILHPDPAVPVGHVIETYDVAKLAGFQQVSFAVNPDSP